MIHERESCAERALCNRASATFATEAAVNYASNLLRILPELRPTPRAARKIDALRNSVGIPAIPDSLLSDFNKSFLVRNYLKCSYVLHVLRSVIDVSASEHVVDIGCGAAPFAYALGSSIGRGLRIDLIDKSEKQLAAATKLLRSIPCSFDTRPVLDNVRSLSDQRFSCGFVLSSYALCELELGGVQIEHLLGAAKMLIVDYDRIIDRMYASAKSAGRLALRGIAKLSVDEALKPFISQDVIRVSYLFIRS